MLEEYPSRRQFVSTVGLGGLALAGVGVGTAGARDRFRRNGAILTGQAHDIVDETDAVGLAKFLLTPERLYFSVYVANIEDVTMAHIHLEAVDGPVTVWLHDHESASQELLEGRVAGPIGRGIITDEDVSGPIDTVDELADEIAAENAYVNVHTEAYPGGEIGGQIQHVGRGRGRGPGRSDGSGDDGASGDGGGGGGDDGGREDGGSGDDGGGGGDDGGGSGDGGSGDDGGGGGDDGGGGDGGGRDDGGSGANGGGGGDGAWGDGNRSNEGDY